MYRHLRANFYVILICIVTQPDVSKWKTLDLLCYKNYCK